jgi:hypothetical protein
MLIHRVAYAIVAGASCIHIVQEYFAELILVSNTKTSLEYLSLMYSISLSITLLNYNLTCDQGA